MNDVQITDLTRISRADIEAGLLKYTPPADENGNDYTAFTYAVNDGRIDSEVGAMTIHVTPVNDAPTSQDRFVGIVGEMPVVFSGILPDLFREGQGIVAQGKLRDDGVFHADQVLAKHDENYMPPEVDHAISEAMKDKLE